MAAGIVRAARSSSGSTDSAMDRPSRSAAALSSNAAQNASAKATARPMAAAALAACVRHRPAASAEGRDAAACTAAAAVATTNSTELGAGLPAALQGRPSLTHRETSSVCCCASPVPAMVAPTRSARAHAVA